MGIIQSHKLVSIVSVLVFSLLGSLALASPNSRAERILGYLPVANGLIFQVTSHGCTYTDDFVVNLSRDPQLNRVIVTLIRTRPDTCYARIPGGVRLQYSYKGLGLQPQDNLYVSNMNGVFTIGNGSSN